MKQIKLFPHNEEGYKKLILALKNNDFVSINHATGTGKSFIILKYLYENRNKKILYLSSSYPILDQLVNEHMKELGIDINSFDCMDFDIYSNLLEKDLNEIVEKYDIIILDEYHRCGAKKWGQVINKLLSLIKKSAKKIRVIGTTATEIRYLDHERNMNNILFDGVTASTLSLADAILKGILPVFEYVVPGYSFLEKINKIESRVNNILIYEEEKIKYNSMLNDIRFEIQKLIKLSSCYENYLKENGKYLVFSSSIASMADDKITMKKILKNHNYKEYTITYKNGWKRNNDIISDFRNSDKNISHVLYAINILNEGVHVKDIDAIFMLRKTKSPNIYFQQLGRLLSYSRRNDKLLVFDLESNLENHKAIYNLYLEVITRAKELLVTDPKNKERYQYIIDNFKIVDNSSMICKKIDELNELLSIDNLKISRLDGAIKVLENGGDDIYLNTQALLDIYHYQEYITLSQFKRINKLNIEKPSLFLLTEIEFESILKDSINLKDKYNSNNKLFLKVIDFYKNVNSFPSIFSTDKDEVELAKKLMFYYDFFSNSQQEKIASLVRGDLSLIEKITYNGEIEYFNYKVLYEEIDRCLDSKINIGEKVISILKMGNTEKDKFYINKIYENNKFYLDLYDMGGSTNYINKNDDNAKLKRRFDVNMDILFREEFSIYLKKYIDEFNEVKDKKNYLSNLTDEILTFIKDNFRLPEFNEGEKEIFYKKVIFNDYLKEYGFLKKIEDINNLVINEVKSRKRKQILEKVLLFMEEHNGQLPFDSSDDNYEVELFKKYKKYLNDFTDGEISKLIFVQDKYKNYRISLIKRYVSFIKKRGRVPITSMNDEYEKELAIEFQRSYQSFDKDEKMFLDLQLEKIEKNRYSKTRQLYYDMLELRKKGR